MANKMNSTKVVTGVVRLSYANVWEPASINGSNPKYSVSLIIPKSDKQTLDAINAAVDAAIKEGVAKFGGKIPNKAALKLPLRDGDTERDDEAYKNSFFVNANSTTAPQIVDRSVQPILDRSEVYSGCYARVSVNFYAFNSNGNRGIACGLGNIQKVRDGEPLGGFRHRPGRRLPVLRKECNTMELIQNILVTALLGIWACLSIGFFVWLVQGISNDHKREKREKEQASRDLEYHEKRMKELK